VPVPNMTKSCDVPVPHMTKSCDVPVPNMTVWYRHITGLCHV
jgi:hypothetical protein